MENFHKKEMREFIYQDIHRGYSDNFNSILQSCMSLLIASLGVLWSFGYVFLYSTNELPSCWFEMQGNNFLNLKALCFTTISALIALTGIIMLLMYQGVAGRNEQFITHSIRRISEIVESNVHEIFPKDYHPYQKEDFKIMQGLYGEIVKLLIGISIIIYGITFIRMAILDCRITKVCLFSSSFLLLFFTGIFIPFILCWYWKKQKRKYEHRRDEYLKKLYAV